jgi:hypothetical protein
MNVLRLQAPSDLRLHDGPLSETDLGEVMLHGETIGICGSELERSLLSHAERFVAQRQERRH